MTVKLKNICELYFSTVTITKSKKQLNNFKNDNLNVALQESLSPIKPQLDLIISNKQAHIWH